MNPIAQLIARQISKLSGGIYDESKIATSKFNDTIQRGLQREVIDDSREMQDYVLDVSEKTLQGRSVFLDTAKSDLAPDIDPYFDLALGVETTVRDALTDIGFTKPKRLDSLYDGELTSVPIEDEGLYKHLLTRLRKDPAGKFLTPEGENRVALNTVAALKSLPEWKELKDLFPKLESSQQQSRSLPADLENRQANLSEFLKGSQEKGFVFRGVDSDFVDSEWDLRFALANEIGPHVGTLGQANAFMLASVEKSVPKRESSFGGKEGVFQDYLMSYTDIDGQKIADKAFLEDFFAASGEASRALRGKKFKTSEEQNDFIKDHMDKVRVKLGDKYNLGLTDSADAALYGMAPEIRPATINKGYIKTVKPLDIGREGDGWYTSDIYEGDPLIGTLARIVKAMSEETGIPVEKLKADPMFVKLDRDIQMTKAAGSMKPSFENEQIYNIEMALHSRKLRSWIGSYGFDSIRYKNNVEPSYAGESPYSYILFRPEQFKSVFASKFDFSDRRFGANEGGLIKALKEFIGLNEEMREERINYTIKRGDTLAKISEESGVSIEDIQAFNNIENPDKIRAGQFIRLKAPIVKNQMLENFVDYLNPFAGDKTGEDYDSQVVQQLRTAAKNALRKGRRNIKYEDYSGANVKGQVGSRTQRAKDSTIRKILTGSMSPTEQAGWSVGGGQVVIEDDNVYVTDTYDFSRIPKENVRDTYGQVRYIMGEAEAAGVPFSKFDSKIFIGKVGDFGLRARRAKGGRLEKKKMKCNKPKRTPNHPKKSHVVKACEGGKEKVIRFGQQGAKTAGKPKAGESAKMKAKRKSFKARHRRNIKKGKMSAAYWANRVKW
jgi:LysM repeat protein